MAYQLSPYDPSGQNGSTLDVPFYTRVNASGETVTGDTPEHILGSTDGIMHQYIQEPNGQLVLVQAPGSVTLPEAQLVVNGAPPPAPVYGNSTGIDAINDAGVVVGWFTDANGKVHGFVDDHGKYAVIDYPNAASTYVKGIDANGNISGYYIRTPGGPNEEFVGQPGFYVDDRSTNTGHRDTGHAYQGPVSGLSDEIVVLTQDNINITAFTDNVFIHSGGGMDAIQAHGGNNVLDGGTGSNFLVGSNNGNDTFFADARDPVADLWSTLVNFHAGDRATIWGLKEAAPITWVNDEGADNYHGLTMHTMVNGRNVSVTMAGYSEKELADGKIAVSYGHTDTVGTLTGSDYMMLTRT